MPPSPPQQLAYFVYSHFTHFFIKQTENRSLYAKSAKNLIKQKHFKIQLNTNNNNNNITLNFSLFSKSNSIFFQKTFYHLLLLCKESFTFSVQILVYKRPPANHVLNYFPTLHPRPYLESPNY